MNHLHCIQLAWSPEVLDDPCPECGDDLILVFYGWSYTESPVAITRGGICSNCDIAVSYQLPQQESN